MKKTILALGLLAGLMMTSCKPETLNEQLGIPEGAMLLSTERFSGNGTKTSVSGTSAQWDGGETVYLNGHNYEVQIADGTAYISVSQADRDGETYGYTGLQGTPIWNSGSNELTVSVPAEYTSSYSNGRQVIALPMVAYKLSGEASNLEFKHVTAAVKVRIKNTTDYVLELDKVVISSESLQLSGSRTVTLSSIDISNQTGELLTDDKSVTVNLAANTFINKYTTDDDIIEVQVPILPVAGSDNLTIKVYAHVAGTPAKANTYEYSYAASNAALARNVMITAGVNLGGTNTTSNLKGVFSVSGTKRVFFSKGNLQYQASTSTWRFAENQYDYVGDATHGNVYVDAVKSNNANIANDYNGWIDLFGWGTSGYNGKNPYMTTTTNSQYGDGTDVNDIASSNYDWGVYNKISNGGGCAGMWRTMTGGTESEEWHYVMITRSNTTSNLPSGTNQASANFVRASVNDVSGIILFPDGYIHPDGAGVASKNPTYNGAYSSFSSFAVDKSGWIKMESAGAIFIPQAGYRNNKNYYSDYTTYWTSSHYTGSSSTYNAYYANQNGVKNYNHDGRSKGYAVRLVQNL